MPSKMLAVPVEWYIGFRPGSNAAQCVEPASRVGTVMTASATSDTSELSLVQC